ncbi:DsbC family protein [Aeromonas cavernicola]|uniref:Thiol:disulfide interchange protein n=1 Tax=Aeromonas cavernicola TaxID=1006623 RepID=A0A2H9U4F3_9GAMM|nr:DsbC family protein [Aeromonas cavernicola]PJG58933.1 disulfide bond formation protein DsbC [Aeromonas cavernicola]
MLIIAFNAKAGAAHQELRQVVSERLGVPVYLVEQSPIAGLYMLGTSQGLFYSDANGDYLLQGVMLDMTQQMKNLTLLEMRAQRRLGLAQVSYSPRVFQASDELYRVALFVGEDCPYCHHLPAALQQLQRLGVSVEVYPVIDHPEQAAAWCDDPLLQNNSFHTYLPHEGCNEILTDNIGLSQWLGIKVLPTWVTSSGDLVRGYQSPERLLKILDNFTDASAHPSSSAR